MNKKKESRVPGKQAILPPLVISLRNVERIHSSLKEADDGHRRILAHPKTVALSGPFFITTFLYF